MALILFASFFALLIIGMPVAFSLALAVWAAISLGSTYPQIVIVKEMFSGLDSFPLMAVPFFILAAELMSSGGLGSPAISSGVNHPIPSPSRAAGSPSQPATV